MHIDRYQLVASCNGRWSEIFLALAPELSPALDQCYKNGALRRNPGKVGEINHEVCGSSSFRFTPKWLELGSAAVGGDTFKTGIDTIMFVNSWGFIETLKAVHEFINDSIVKFSPRKRAASISPKKDLTINKQKLENAIKFSKRDIVSRKKLCSYFNNRGIDINLDRIPSELRLGWRHYYEDGEKIGEYDAIMSPFRNLENDLVSLHQTFLDGNVKADVRDTKKFLSPCGDMNGGAIRLDQPDTEFLAIGEGIENSLVVREAFHDSGFAVPTWATASASFMKSVKVPAHVIKVAIFADNDEAGIKAAQQLAARLEDEGKIVSIFVPPLFDGSEGSDWLGYATHYAKANNQNLIFNIHTLARYKYSN